MTRPLFHVMYALLCFVASACLGDQPRSAPEPGQAAPLSLGPACALPEEPSRSPASCGPGELQDPADASNASPGDSFSCSAAVSFGEVPCNPGNCCGFPQADASSEGPRTDTCTSSIQAISSGHYLGECHCQFEKGRFEVSCFSDYRSGEATCQCIDRGAREGPASEL